MNGTGPLMSLVPVSYQRNHRGFTGHEHLDEWGLVNMNGRIYNPDIGRFLSADPYVQFPQRTQGLDRYAYLQNNPLSATDPCGHGILSILGSIIAVIPGPWQAVGYAMIAVDGYLEGGLRGVVMSALSATAANLVGGMKFASNVYADAALRAVTHGLVQGGISRAFGGDFRASFLSAGFSSAAGSLSPRFGGGGDLGKVLRVLRASVIGGTASVIGGGKFSNGATTAAFVQAFNHEHSRQLADAYDKLDFDPNGESLPSVALGDPKGAGTALNTQARANEDTDALFRIGAQHNNSADAFRHANWSFRLAKALGADRAKAITDAYERWSVNPPSERIMDLYNNFVGRYIATMPEYRALPAPIAVRRALENGYLINSRDRFRHLDTVP